MSSQRNPSHGRCLESTTVEALIERVASRREKEALSQLFDEYAPRVHAVGIHILREPDAATQLVQDVFLLTWYHAGFFDRLNESGLNWLFRLAYWCCFKRRSQAGLSWNALYQAFPREFPRSPGRASSIFAALPELQRRILTLFYFEGRTLAQISEAINQSIDDVRKNFYEAGKLMAAAAGEIVTAPETFSVSDLDVAAADPLGC